jgi:hypothetical protein
MKVLYQDYNFNASEGKVTFNTTEVVRLENVLLVTNVTDNIIIYNFADPILGGTISNNVLTAICAIDVSIVIIKSILLTLITF